MKKILSNDEMKNIFGGDYVQRRINNWEISGGGGGWGGGSGGVTLFREAVGKVLQWAWSWFD